MYKTNKKYMQQKNVTKHFRQKTTNDFLCSGNFFLINLNNLKNYLIVVLFFTIFFYF